ncbi:MAG: sigma-70 family RNA polymerase sigma factor [Planctomycetes bacterium]|nr:sigma-70 family RNA polymerase sigma factor [Planctomycetota bacterium]
MTQPAPRELVADLFRHRYGRMVTGLVRVLGADRIDLAEDVVQEALLRALRTWPAEGVPDRPDAWVFRVARNLALDALRRRHLATRIEDDLVRWAKTEVEAAPHVHGAHDDGLGDDTLRMMFACCHPSVPSETRVPLILKTVSGFSVQEIAAALLAKEGSIAQRLTRGKARLGEMRVRFEVPTLSELPERLPLVLEVLYLMFNEGYRAHRGQDLVRQDLVEEAVRLCALLLEVPTTTRPEVHALLALMLMLGARLPARTDALGELLTLAEQDRTRWDARWLHCGFDQFRRSIGGDTISTYHIEAAIASEHSAAADYAATNWPRLLHEYDRLLALTDTPIVRLNRAVVLAKVAGLEAALAELAALERAPSLHNYFLLSATKAHMLWQSGDREAAARELEHALQLPCSAPEERLLRRRLQACRSGAAPPAW